MITQFQQLLSSGSKAMNVNGSGTPVEFNFTASVNTRVKALKITLKDEGTTSLDKFGALTALTNGLLVQWTIGGVSRTFATLKDNGDLCNCFSDHQHFGNSAILSILSIVTPEGFGASANVFRGKAHFDEGVVLASGDKVSITVQDDIHLIDFLNVGVLLEVD